MSEELNAEFWSARYAEGDTRWDLGSISRPLKEFVDQLENKNLSILIPGSGNGYEAEYLWLNGFKNVFVIDYAEAPLKNLQQRCPSFPKSHCYQGDFFLHEGKYDLILEQTMFCAIDPSFREKYVQKVKSLLKPEGKLVGVLFDMPLESGPPFGGRKVDYLKLFGKEFSSIRIEPCYNSIEPRMGRELFISVQV